jgi:glutathione S-transferase
MIGWHERMAPLFKDRDLAAIRARVSALSPDRQAMLDAALADSYSEDQLERARTSLRVVVRRLEETLAASPWLAGERYSLADIALFPMAMSLPGLLPAFVNDLSAPHLLEWLRIVRGREAVREALDKARTPDPTRVFAPGPELARWG